MALNTLFVGPISLQERITDSVGYVGGS
jgi:hypothetical protein